MKSERQRVTKALDVLTAGLFPFVEREMKAVYKHEWHDVARGSFRDNFRDGRQHVYVGGTDDEGSVIRWDVHALLVVLWDQWNRVFRHRLGPAERCLISELREFRNRWAHQVDFDTDDTYRILDSVHRLLAAVEAPEADFIAHEKYDLLRRHVGRQAQLDYRRAQVVRRRWLDFGVYLICCLSLVFVILYFFGTQASFLAGFCVVIFIFLAHRRIATPPPMFFGPRECSGCGKIIYSEACPYCETTPAAKSIAAPETDDRLADVPAMAGAEAPDDSPVASL